MRTPVIAIFDIGKTNKKLLLFDEQYQIVSEESVQLDNITDEDGDSCEDIARLSDWLLSSFKKLSTSRDVELRAVNVAAYGASFVHLDQKGKLLTPLYDYQKPFPGDLQDQFYATYGGRIPFSIQTASPVLGSLNSGLQLFRLKEEKKEIFSAVHYSLHLPQYLSWLLTGQYYSEITSIGCHTGLWDFFSKTYHSWVSAEGISSKMAPILMFDKTLPSKVGEMGIPVGTGLHDSSSALIPYLKQFKEPFILLSTGTWNISLNPFNNSPLTPEDLSQDCLCYLDYTGRQVKASRLFAGNEHEQHVKVLAEHFHVQPEYFKSVQFDKLALNDGAHKSISFNTDNRSGFKNYEQAYHQLIHDIVSQQFTSTSLVLDSKSNVRRIFVDGGFSKNPVFMHLLAAVFPNLEIYAASVPHATAMGAAMAIHSAWNTYPEPLDLIKLKRY